MTLLEEILAGGFDLANRDDGAIAAALSVGRKKPVSRSVGIGTILAVMAPHGGDFLNALEALAPANANVKWALKLIEQGGLDVGMAATREQLSAFADATPEMKPGIDALLALGEADDIITAQAVAKALEGYEWQP